jgi:tetratricopeptide (TPR) repeat protein
LWEDCISSNTAAKEAAICYAEKAGMPGHWDEELHAIDYLVYANLQKGDTVAARQLLQYTSTLKVIQPMNFKVAYALAAVPSRIALENKNWTEASGIELNPNVPWEKFPWQESIVHFTRLLGAVHNHRIPDAESELKKLNQFHDKLAEQKVIYQANQVAIQIKAGQAWIAFANGKTKVALSLMKEAADMEDATSKHPVTPGEVLPAREMYADMLVDMKDYKSALNEYKAVLEKSPNRRNSLKGKALASLQ